MACVGAGPMRWVCSITSFLMKGFRLIGCEAAGRYRYRGTCSDNRKGSVGIFHGMKSYFCQDEDGQIAPVYSISAGLDYPGIGPEHAYLHDSGRAEYVPVTDDEAVDAFEYLSRLKVLFQLLKVLMRWHMRVKLRLL